MAEPTTSAAALGVYSAGIPLVTAFGVPLGLRADLLVAGFCGALVAIILLNTVPAQGDTWGHMLRATLRRLAVVLASSLTAAYLAPLALLLANIPDALLLGGSFAVGGGAQQVLIFAIKRLSGGPQTSAGGAQ